MSFEISPSGQPFGASVTGLDLSKPVSSSVVSEIREAWLKHHVLAFPDQAISDDDLERFTLLFGPFGDDPFIAPIPLFVNQHLALEHIPDELRQRIEGKQAIHSARNAYAPTGFYGADDRAAGRSMDIRPSDDAEATQLHPLISSHPETGREALFGCAGYIVGIDGMDQAESWDLLTELFRWQTQPQFQYRHKWQPRMLLMWDNRSLLHMATGGYKGFDRLLHRTTIGSA